MARDNLDMTSRILALLSYLFLLHLSLQAQELVVDGRGGNPRAPNPDDDNGQPGIQPAGRTSSGRTYPADSCLRRRTFKTLQSALYALDRQYLQAAKIRITASSPLQGHDRTVPRGVSRDIFIRHDLEIYSGRTVPAVIEGGVMS